MFLIYISHKCGSTHQAGTQFTQGWPKTWVHLQLSICHSVIHLTLNIYILAPQNSPVSLDEEFAHIIDWSFNNKLTVNTYEKQEITTVETISVFIEHNVSNKQWKVSKKNYAASTQSGMWQADRQESCTIAKMTARSALYKWIEWAIAEIWPICLTVHICIKNRSQAVTSIADLTATN